MHGAVLHLSPSRLPCHTHPGCCWGLATAVGTSGRGSCSRHPLLLIFHCRQLKDRRRFTSPPARAAPGPRLHPGATIRMRTMGCMVQIQPCAAPGTTWTTARATTGTRPAREALATTMVTAASTSWCPGTGGKARTGATGGRAPAAARITGATAGTAPPMASVTNGTPTAWPWCLASSGCHTRMCPQSPSRQSW